MFDLRYDACYNIANLLQFEMDPLQRMNAPKKHPLAFTTKTDKLDPKIAKQAIPGVQAKQVKEETIIEKPSSESHPHQLKVQIKKQEAINQVESLPKEQVCIPVQQAKVSVNLQQKEAKIDKPQQSLEIPRGKQEKQSISTKPQTKIAEKRQVKDIFSQTSKNKSPLQALKVAEPITIVKVEQKKQAIIQESVVNEPQAKPERWSVTKKQQIAYKSLQIGQKMDIKETERHPVHININQSSQKGSGLLKSTYYHVTGEDEHGPINISRKYEEFEALSDILHERWPGCFLPALTKESEAKKQGEKDRHKRATLANFLLGLSHSSHVYYREEVQLFLRSPDVQASEMFRKMPPLKTRDVISRLRSSFGQLLDQPASPAHATRINNFVAALRKVIGNLGSLSLKALALSDAYEGYSLSLGKFSRIHKSYQQLCLAQYRDIGGQRAVVIPDSENKLERLQDLTKYNPFLKLHSFLSSEVRDAEAFIQVIIASELFVLRKEDLQREIKELQVDIEGIMLGHKSLKTMASRRPKEELQGGLQARQKKLTEQRDTMVEMFGILQILLATRSISHFQTFKRDNYRGILEEWAQVTQQSSPQLEAVWQFIAEDSRTHLKA